jgi:hypothetical protein
VWGNKDNNFYSAWKNQAQLAGIKNEFLPISSKERFVLLTVSPAFARKDIRGMASPAAQLTDQGDCGSRTVDG